MIEEAAAPVIIEEKPRGQREQPKRKDRNKPRPVIEEIQDKPVPPSDGDADGPSTPAPGAPTKPKK